jgi:hypothetical protein
MPVKEADSPFAVSSSQYLKSKSVRNRVADAAMKARKIPKVSRTQKNSMKPIPRNAGRISYDGRM